MKGTVTVILKPNKVGMPQIKCYKDLMFFDTFF
jgi:hypothetical protein